MIKIVYETKAERLLHSILQMEDKVSELKTQLAEVCKEKGMVFVAGAKAEMKSATGYNKEEALKEFDLSSFMTPDYTQAFNHYAKKNMIDKESFRVLYPEKLVITRSKG